MVFSIRSIAALMCVVSGSVSSFISTTRDGMAYDLVAVSSDGSLVLAQSSVVEDSNNRAYGIAMPRLTQKSASVAPELQLEGKLAAEVLVHRKYYDESKKQVAIEIPKIENPIRGSYIQDLAVAGEIPIVAYGADTDHAHSLAALYEGSRGAVVSLNASPINDAAGKATRTIKKIAAGLSAQEGIVFAAVTPSDSADFAGQDAAGIATLLVAPYGIVPVRPLKADAIDGATALSADAMKIGSTGGITDVTCMVWDSFLQRLYVGLATEDGGVAVMVGILSLEKGTTSQGTKIVKAFLTLRPLVAALDGTNAAGDWSGNDFIVADKNDGMSVDHLAVMHASTGVHHLVVGRDDVSVFALPLVGAKTGLVKSVQVGCAATITDYTQPATLGSDEQLYTTSSDAALVGGGDAPGTINHLLVNGDAVVVSCSGDDATQRGVFLSQALFARDGSIRGWSAWMRVVDGEGSVQACSFDVAGRAYFITDNHTKINTTVWNTSAEVLTARVQEALPLSAGGVHSLAAFEQTPSTIVVAGGKNACALAITGIDGVVTTQAQFSEPAYFTSYDFADHACDVGYVRSSVIGSDGGQEWLFVGGTKGCAVLSAGDGDGWDSLDDLSSLDGFSFKELQKSDATSFGNVRALQADEAYVYVLTDTTLYRFAYDADVFAAGGNVAEESIATVDVLCGSTNHALLSFSVIGDYGMLATTAGLFTMASTARGDVANVLGDGGWRVLWLDDAHAVSFGVTSQIFFVPAAGEGGGGQLYVLSADMSLMVSTVYRISVPSNDWITDASMLSVVTHTIDQERGYMTFLGLLREYFYTDGSFAFDVGSHHVPNNVSIPVPIRSVRIDRSIGSVDRWHSGKIPTFEDDEIMRTVSGIVRDPASGALIIAGIWGIRVLR